MLANFTWEYEDRERGSEARGGVERRGHRVGTKKTRNAETRTRGAKRCPRQMINNRAVVIKRDKRSFSFAKKEKKKKIQEEKGRRKRKQPR